MKNKTLHFLFVFCCCFWLVRLNAQSNIGVTIGLEFSNIQTSLPEVFFFDENGYSNKNILLGLRVERQLSKSFFLSLQSDYTKKDIAASSRGIVPFDKISFSRYRTSLAFNWTPINLLSIGLGPSLHYIPKVDHCYGKDLQYAVKYQRKEIGGLFSLGCIYKRFMFEVNYYQGISTIGANDASLKPFNSINLSFHYLFKLGHKKQGGAKNKSRF